MAQPTPNWVPQVADWRTNQDAHNRIQQQLAQQGTSVTTLQTQVATLQTQAAQPTMIEVPANVSGTPGASQTYALKTFTQATKFSPSFSGSQGSVGTVPTATAIFNVQQNGTNVGTMTVAPVTGIVTFATSSGTGFTCNPGDRLSIVAPASADATLADLAITLQGQLL